jgi:hypothetical protein
VEKLTEAMLPGSVAGVSVWENRSAAGVVSGLPDQEHERNAA